MLATLGGILALTIGLALLLLPVVVSELSRPRDSAWGAVVLLLGLVLVTSADRLTGAPMLAVLCGGLLIGRLGTEVGQARWRQLSSEEQAALGSRERWLTSLDQLLTTSAQLLAAVLATVGKLNQALQERRQTKATTKRWVRKNTAADDASAPGPEDGAATVEPQGVPNTEPVDLETSTIRRGGNEPADSIEAMLPGSGDAEPSSGAAEVAPELSVERPGEADVADQADEADAPQAIDGMDPGDGVAAEDSSDSTPEGSADAAGAPDEDHAADAIEPSGGPELETGLTAEGAFPEAEAEGSTALSADVEPPASLDPSTESSGWSEIESVLQPLAPAELPSAPDAAEELTPAATAELNEAVEPLHSIQSFEEVDALLDLPPRSATTESTPDARVVSRLPSRPEAIVDVDVEDMPAGDPDRR
jgi:hypothetical protein